MTTLVHVAKRASVSKACASFILSGHPTGGKFSPETRIKVQRAARELAYTPNALARGLARKSVSTISLVFHYAELFSHWSGFPAEMMRAASQAAFQLGYDLLLHTKSTGQSDFDAAALTDGRSDGALLFRHRADELVNSLLARRLPFVLMFCRSSQRRVSWVDCDHREGARLATDYLIRLGHRRILHLSGNPDASDAIALRRQGFLDALRQHRLPFTPDNILNVGWEGSSNQQFQPLAELLQSSNRPTALFAWYDGLAIRAIRLARSLGLRIPQDLSVIGFDSTAICDQIEPRLTSIRQPVQQIVSIALDLLARRLKGDRQNKVHSLLAPTLDVRASCAPPPSQDSIRG
jgi:DNA-binding LacI/PurR family transcriptional regulator